MINILFFLGVRGLGVRLLGFKGSGENTGTVYFLKLGSGAPHPLITYNLITYNLTTLQPHTSIIPKFLQHLVADVNLRRTIYDAVVACTVKDKRIAALV